MATKKLRLISRAILGLVLVLIAGSLFQIRANPPGKKPRRPPDSLSENDVKRIIAQAVVQTQAKGLRAVIAVVDREGNALAIFKMNGAPNDLIIPAPSPLNGNVPNGKLQVGPDLPVSATVLAAVSKAGTGAFLSSQGHAFSTRTASFIVQQHFPPQSDQTPGGPLFGVQFSQIAFCGDINPVLPLGLSADPGGLPIYKDGKLVGGIGVEADGIYDFDRDHTDFDIPPEEEIALAATNAFEAPPEIRAEKIIVNGIVFPFVNAATLAPLVTPPFDQLPGQLDPVLVDPDGVRPAQPSRFEFRNVDGLDVRVDPDFFPPKTESLLSLAEVQQILLQGVRQANITRAAIRQPVNSPAQVNIAVVDIDGRLLGLVSTPDAPLFGFDVCVQKARAAAFFSKPSAGNELRQAGLGRYVDALAAEGIRLDGSIAFSNRAIGFLARPFFPDGIDETEQGPLSVPIEVFSPFNVGIQLDLLFPVVKKILQGELNQKACTEVPGLENGIQIFPGSVPLYKNQILVGAIGVSGDGVDQDDLVTAMGSAGFEAPPQIRSDRIFVRKVRLPYVKFPRHPNL